MKLYELKRGDLFKLKESQPIQPPDILSSVNEDLTYKHHNTDGMYSYNTDTEGNVFHFAAYTEVDKL